MQPLACRLDAMDATQRERYRTLGGRLKSSVQHARELDDGWAFGFAPDTTLCLAIAEFITLERLCCPYASPSSSKRTMVPRGCA